MQQQDINHLEDKIKKEYQNIAGIMIWKNGESVYENYFNGCTPQHKIHVFSVTKSVISILIGIAIDKGFIASIDQKVIDFFPEYTTKKREHTLQNIKLRDLMTMSAPYKYKFNPYTKYFTSDDWVKFSLDTLGGKGKIGEFRYAPLIGPDILSGILRKTTGQSVLEFARANLFQPLGIMIHDDITFSDKSEQMKFYKSIAYDGWVMDPKGTHTAGWGLTLSPLDMTKIGQLYLNSGIWENTRIVTEKWVQDSTIEHSRWQKLNLPYGYLWWIDEHQEGFAAMGDGGNILYVNTKMKLVVAITSLFVPKAKDRIDFIKQEIEPLFIHDK